MLKIYAAVNKVGNLWKLNKSLASRSRKPSVAACERLCGLRAKDVASEDTGETAAGRCSPCGQRSARKFYGKYLQRKNDVVNRSEGSLAGKIQQFGPAEKILDKGRWSQSAHLPVTAARNAGRVKGLRDSSSLLARVVGFEDFQIQGGRWDKKSSVPKRLRSVGLEL